MTSRLVKLREAGQSPWIDYLDRAFLEAGSLRKLVEEDGVSGVTSNPAIFEKAIGHSNAYDEQIRSIIAAGLDTTVDEIYEAIVIDDIRSAADVLRPVYDRSNAVDGYVSLEV